MRPLSAADCYRTRSECQKETTAIAALPIGSCTDRVSLQTFPQSVPIPNSEPSSFQNVSWASARELRLGCPNRRDWNRSADLAAPANDATGCAHARSRLAGLHGHPGDHRWREPAATTAALRSPATSQVTGGVGPSAC